MANTNGAYPASLEVEYPKLLDRKTTFLRIFYLIPVFILLSLLTSGGGSDYMNQAGKQVSAGGGGITFGLFAATALMIAFRQKYPRWWFDFALELNRFSARVGAYMFLLTDKYPSTTDNQSVQLDVEYPNVTKDLTNWMPLVKWILVIPHYIVLAFLALAAVIAAIVAWFAILFTGQYPKSLFDFVVGVGRWCLRVEAYAILLTTDQYPPFSLK